MRIEDKACLAKGIVSPSFVDIATGERVPFSRRNNTLSFMSAEAMAAAFGGDPTYIPSKVGFIYGNLPTMPSEADISRNQKWGLLKEELWSSDTEGTVDMQVVGFSYPPSLGAEKSSHKESADSGSSAGQSSSSSSSSSSSPSSPSGSSVDDSGNDYNNILATGSNAITFHAVSNSQDRGKLFGKAAFANGNYIYQAVLLAYDIRTDEYHIISRVSMKENGAQGSSSDSSSSGGGYLRKPDGFEVALDWTIVFH